MKEGKKILIAPLDWGLGHTTRCIPIAHHLHSKGHSIIFGVDKTQQALLENEVPFANFIFLEGYKISYPKSISMGFKMLLESPKILKRIKTENLELKRLITEHCIDVVISDNRFGLYSNKIPSYYITHQINIQGPNFIKKRLYKIHEKYINKYTECWIPDTIDNTNLGGELSHGNAPVNSKFIGPLSRFKSIEKKSNEESTYEYLAIISGPEPQRSKFEEIIFRELDKTKMKSAIIGGKPLSSESLSTNNITYYNHLNTIDFESIVSKSKKIICRPGYSTIMDLSILQKPAHFIPTPGQTEQEYLAKYHMTEEWSNQNKFKLTLSTPFKKIPYFEGNLDLSI